MTGICKSIKIS